MAVILTGASLRWMAGILTPVLLAVFLAVMVDGLSRVIRRKAPVLPQGASLFAAIAIFAMAMIALGAVVSVNGQEFVASLTQAQPKINLMINQGAHLLHLRGPGSVDHMLRRLDPTQYLGAIANAVEEFASNAVLVLIYLGFLIAARHTFERKAVRIFRSREARQDAVEVFLHVRDGIERYLWIQTVLGLMIAGASWALLMAMGLNNAFFWAFVIFIVNYIPIIGAAVAIVLPALFGLAQFDGYARPLIILAGLFAITFVIGNILLPRMQGNSLNLDPFVVLFSLAFWGALWGLTGMFLSTPLTVLTMVVLAQFDSTRWIAVLLSADGDPQKLGRGSERAPDVALGTT